MKLKSARCYACGKPLRSWQTAYMLDDDQAAQPVGSDCFRHVVQAGERGWQPPQGGPPLFHHQQDARAAYGVARSPTTASRDNRDGT